MTVKLTRWHLGLAAVAIVGLFIMRSRDQDAADMMNLPTGGYYAQGMNPMMNEADSEEPIGQTRMSSSANNTANLRAAMQAAMLAAAMNRAGAANSGIYPTGNGGDFYDANTNSSVSTLPNQNGAYTEQYDNGGYNLHTSTGSVLSDGEGHVMLFDH